MADESTATVDRQETTELAGKYLTFKLDEEIYGLEILKVQEIIEMLDITKVPRTPDYVKGVINLRGKVIPVVNLRKRFGMLEQENSRNTCIVVVYIRKADEDITMGLIVDQVREVVEVAPANIEPPPGFGTQVDTSFILGMAKSEDAVTMLLDIDRVFSDDEKDALDRAGSNA